MWQHEAKLLAPDGASADTFGYAVAIHEDQVVVGARGDDDNGARSGSVHMFARNKKRRWKWMQKLLAPEGSEGDEFGWSVSMHRGIVAVGSYGDDEQVHNHDDDDDIANDVDASTDDNIDGDTDDRKLVRALE